MTLELRLPLGDSGGVALAESLISTAVNLRSLIVSKCSLGSKGLAAIGSSLASNRCIAKLDLSVQDVTLRPSMAEQGLRPLLPVFQSLGTNRGLVELIVTDIIVQDEDIQEACEAIEKSRNTIIRTIRHAPIHSDIIATRLDNLLTENAERLRRPQAMSLAGVADTTSATRDAAFSPASSSVTNSEAGGAAHGLSYGGAGAGASEEYVSFGIPGRNHLAALLAVPKVCEVREDQLVDLVVDD
jgi:hypothetical protein